MKSNKQRRAEIKQRRIERATRLAAQRTPDGTHLRLAGMEPADQAVLAIYNNTYGPLPDYYLDRAFTCRDCGAEEVWTAKQQKWWYEVVHGAIDSTAVRCLACRRARRAAALAIAAHEGANLLALEGERLRALGDAPPDADARAEVEAALQSKWWGLRVLAIGVLGRWGDSESVARLRGSVSPQPAPWRTWEREGSDAAAKALAALAASRPVD